MQRTTGIAGTLSSHLAGLSILAESLHVLETLPLPTSISTVDLFSTVDMEAEKVIYTVSTLRDFWEGTSNTIATDISKDLLFLSQDILTQLQIFISSFVHPMSFEMFKSIRSGDSTYVFYELMNQLLLSLSLTCISL